MSKAANIIKDAANAKADAKAQKDAIARVAELEEQVAKQQERIEALNKKRTFSIPVAKGKKGKTFLRVIVADTHGCWIDKPAASAFLKDLAMLAPAEVVLLGDHLDCSGWLAEHHPFMTVQESKYTFAEDLEAANVFLDEVHKASPGSEKHYLSGNHEERIQAFVVKASKQNPRDAAYLYSLFGPRSIMSLDDRNITYYERTENHCGLRAKGVLQLGQCYFVHGTSHAQNAARVHLQQHKRCVVFGHVHRRMQAGTSDVDSEMDAWCPGCLCHFEPMWKHSVPTEWGHGYAVQVVTKDGKFLHINVPIIDGESYLAKLTNQLG